MWRRNARRERLKAQHLECGKFRIYKELLDDRWLLITRCSFSLSDDPSSLCNSMKFCINFSLARCFLCFSSRASVKMWESRLPLVIGIWWCYVAVLFMFSFVNKTRLAREKMEKFEGIFSGKFYGFGWWKKSLFELGILLSFRFYFNKN